MIYSHFKVRVVTVLTIIMMALLLVLGWSQSYSCNENDRLVSSLFYFMFGDNSLFHINSPFDNNVSADLAIVTGMTCPNRDYTPVDMAGYSIYIYHITQEEIDRTKQKTYCVEKIYNRCK